MKHDGSRRYIAKEKSEIFLLSKSRHYTLMGELLLKKLEVFNHRDEIVISRGHLYNAENIQTRDSVQVIRVHVTFDKVLLKLEI